MHSPQFCIFIVNPPFVISVDVKFCLWSSGISGDNRPLSIPHMVRCSARVIPHDQRDEVLMNTSDSRDDEDKDGEITHHRSIERVNLALEDR